MCEHGRNNDAKSLDVRTKANILLEGVAWQRLIGSAIPEIRGESHRRESEISDGST